MKPIFTNLEITRLAYSEVSHNKYPIGGETTQDSEFLLLKHMQNVVDQCLIEPSQQSIDKILSVLNSYSKE